MNLKRFGAIIGIIILVLLYLTTLVLAIIGNPQTQNMFKASVFLTFFIPITLYAFIMMHKFFNK